MRVTFVKKVLASGAPCGKCDAVERRLRRSGLIARIDRVVVADERDADSAGMRLARRHQVEIAPFFLVEDGGSTIVYTVYLKFVREIFGSLQPGSARGTPLAGKSSARGSPLAGKSSARGVPPRKRGEPTPSAELEEARDLLRANPDLDLI